MYIPRQPSNIPCRYVTNSTCTCAYTLQGMYMYVYEHVQCILAPANLHVVVEQQEGNLDVIYMYYMQTIQTCRHNTDTTPDALCVVRYQLALTKKFIAHRRPCMRLLTSNPLDQVCFSHMSVCCLEWPTPTPPEIPLCGRCPELLSPCFPVSLSLMSLTCMCIYACMWTVCGVGSVCDECVGCVTCLLARVCTHTQNSNTTRAYSYLN